MSYLQKQLLPDERIVHIATLHWIIFVPGMMLTVIGGILSVLGNGIAGYIMGDASFTPVFGKVISGGALVMTLAGFGFLLGAIVRQSSTELAITNRRLIAKYGMISRSTFEIMVNRVTGVNFDQTITGRMLGYGTVLVHGAGGDISPFDVLSNPQVFQRALMDVVEHARR
ncbi:MAG: PH domain-containing protein [Alphaproteobacteria bacterium]